MEWPLYLVFGFVLAVSVGIPLLAGLRDSRLWAWLRRARGEPRFSHRETLNAVLSLPPERLEELFAEYGQQFGAGAARYAKRTFRRWQSGAVQPQKRTAKRFLVQLPQAMSFDLKCEVLRRLLAEYAARDSYEITATFDDWREKLTPLIETVIEKAYNAQLPPQVARELTWLAQDEAEIARRLLAAAQVEESRLAVAQLEAEFAALAQTARATPNLRKISHTIRLPYGTINVRFKPRK